MRKAFKDNPVSKPDAGGEARQTRVASADCRIALAVLVTLAMLDLTLRAIDWRLSGNLEHISRIPELIRGAGESGNAALILGNSLANNGISAETISSALGDKPIVKITPDATALWDWQCLLEHSVFQQPERRFDTVIIGTAWQLLSDRTRPDPSRLGSLYCRVADLRRPSYVGLRTAGDVGEFMLARISRMYALRDALRNRLLDMFIPHYQRFTSEINAAASDNGARQDAVSGENAQAASYEQFESLVGQAESLGIRVVVVAMPVKEPYELDAGLRRLESSGRIVLLDMRAVPGLGAQHFLDGIHLNSDGRSKLSAALAREMPVRFSGTAR